MFDFLEFNMDMNMGSMLIFSVQLSNPKNWMVDNEMWILLYDTII